MPYKLPRSFYTILFFVLLAANISVYSAIFAPRMLTVNILETGKGSAVLVRTSNGKTILIDTGLDAGILRALGGALPMRQRKIDAIILTSSAARSAGGLSAIEDRYNISKIIRLGDKNIPYGTSFTFDGTGIEILAPVTLTIFYGGAAFNISSSTPAGAYISDGKTFILAKLRRLF